MLLFRLSSALQHTKFSQLLACQYGATTWLTLVHYIMQAKQLVAVVRGIRTDVSDGNEVGQLM